MIDTVEFGEVFVCVFPFTSAHGGKARPVLVLMDLGHDCLICRITSVPHRGFLDKDRRLPTGPRPVWTSRLTVRLSRLVTVEKPILKVRIGKLTAKDSDRVRSLLERQIPLVRRRGTRSRAAWTAGSNSAIKIPMIVMTTNNSTKVKALDSCFLTPDG